MSGARLHDFFTVDDAARARAFAWCAGASIASSMLAHFVFGADKSACVIVMAATTGIVLSMFLAGYVKVRHRFQETTNSQPRRREVIKLSLAAALEAAAALLIVSVFDKSSNAISYASTALDQVRSGQDVSLYKIELAKQTIAVTFRKPGTIGTRKSLVDAYTKLVLAESYLRAKKARLVFSWVEMVGLLNFPVAVGDPHDVIVENSYFESCSLSLSGFAWLDTKFVRCSLRGTVKDILLVNVSFNDCSISFPPEEADSPLAVELRSGSKSGVMFSSAALVTLRSSTHGQ